MNKLKNPYVVGRQLQGKREFFGRQDTLDRIKKDLDNFTTNTLVLFGQRRIGKTSILGQLEQTLPVANYLSIFFDLQYYTNSPLNQILADLVDKIAEKTTLEAPPLHKFDDQGHYFCDTFLPSLYKTLEQEQRLVFLFDELDALDQTIDKNSR